jgi:hypothetical protein
MFLEVKHVGRLSQDYSVGVAILVVLILSAFELFQSVLFKEMLQSFLQLPNRVKLVNLFLNPI